MQKILSRDYWPPKQRAEIERIEEKEHQRRLRAQESKQDDSDPDDEDESDACQCACPECKSGNCAGCSDVNCADENCGGHGATGKRGAIERQLKKMAMQYARANHMGFDKAYAAVLTSSEGQRLYSEYSMLTARVLSY